MSTKTNAAATLEGRTAANEDTRNVAPTSITVDGTTLSIVVHHHRVVDELVAFPFGLEVAAAERLVRAGHLKVARLGRRKYARRSDVLALVDRFTVAPAKAKGDVRADLATLAARTRRGGR